MTAGLGGERSPTRAQYIYGPGDLLQLQHLVAKSRLDIEYYALSPAAVYKLPAELLVEAIGRQKDLANDLLRLTILQSELQAKRIENLSYRFASDKLIYRILHLAERFGVMREESVYIQIPITHRELGMFINMARESVSREMQKLIDKDLIKYERQRITILEPEQLIAALHETIRTDWRSILSA